MKKTYKILDLFCKAGGAGEGYHRAGFEVVGVDIFLNRIIHTHSFKAMQSNF